MILKTIVIISCSINCFGFSTQDISFSDVQKLITTNKNRKVCLNGVEFTKVAGFGPTSSTIQREHILWNERYKIIHKRNSKEWYVHIDNRSRPTTIGAVTIFCVPVALCIFSALYRQHHANLSTNL